MFCWVTNFLFLLWVLSPKGKHKSTAEQYFTALMISIFLPHIMASSSLLRDYPLLLQGWRFTKQRDTWEVLNLFTYQALNLLKSIVMERKSQPILEKSCVKMQFSLWKTSGESARRWACFPSRKKRWKAAAITVKNWQATTSTLH